MVDLEPKVAMVHRSRLLIREHLNRPKNLDCVHVRHTRPLVVDPTVPSVKSVIVYNTLSPPHIFQIVLLHLVFIAHRLVLVSMPIYNLFFLY